MQATYYIKFIFTTAFSAVSIVSWNSLKFLIVCNLSSGPVLYVGPYVTLAVNAHLQITGKMNNLVHKISALEIYSLSRKDYWKFQEYSIFCLLPFTVELRDSQRAAALDSACVVLMLPQGEVAMWTLVIHGFHTDSCKVVIYSAKWKSVKNRW